jgi:hypothetical protein
MSLKCSVGHVRDGGRRRRHPGNGGLTGTNRARLEAAETGRFIATVLHGYVCVWRRTGLEWD